METPSSTKRITRSQTRAAMNSACNNNNNTNIPMSKKLEDSENSISKSWQRTTKQALIDITNDSPIVGLAMETPSSAMTKKNNSRIKNTPGSGERLLRGQVKTLLQKVEEEAVLTKISMESRPFIHLVNSPMGLLAPTPANTPQIPNLIGDANVCNKATEIVIASPVVEEHFRISQVVSDIFEGEVESFESQKSLSITRSLLLDFSDKSESPDSSECSSVVTMHKGESESNKKSPLTPDDDDSSSVWSIQANASSIRDEDDEEEEEGEDGTEEETEDYYDDEEEEEEEEEDLLLLDGLCEGMSNMTVAEFAGKHTRFIYDSNDEEIVKCCDVLRLKGLPTPKGKHFRFADDDDDEEEEEEEEKETISGSSSSA